MHALMNLDVHKQLLRVDMVQCRCSVHVTMSHLCSLEMFLLITLLLNFVVYHIKS